MAAVAQSVGVRRRLEVLDACLTELEDANERGEQTVSPTISAKLRPHITGVCPGMRMNEALDLVFRHQETYLHDQDGGRRATKLRAPQGGFVSTVDPMRGSERLDEADARRLTDAIKGHVHNVYLLMLEAHTGKAWSALGYKTWESYVRAEFGLSRSRSYELLTQARVVQAIRGAAGMSGVPDISTHLAMRMEPRLAGLLDSLRSAASKGWSEKKARERVAGVIRQQRIDLRREHRRSSTGPGLDGMQSSARALRLMAQQSPWPAAATERFTLDEAIQFLATLPPAYEVFGRIGPDQARRMSNVLRAAGWLNDFAEVWAQARRAQDGVAHVAVLNGSLRLALTPSSSQP